jgi:AraC-like DNA-binding protein
MEYAVLLMKQHPEYTLGAISEACGIKSPATFIRNFKAVYGMTPSEFRKQIDESPNAPSILTNDNEK